MDVDLRQGLTRSSFYVILDGSAKTAWMATAWQVRGHSGDRELSVSPLGNTNTDLTRLYDGSVRTSQPGTSELRLYGLRLWARSYAWTKLGCQRSAIDPTQDQVSRYDCNPEQFTPGGREQYHWH